MAILDLPRDQGAEIALTVVQLLWSLINVSVGLLFFRRHAKSHASITSSLPWFYIFLPLNLLLILASDVIKTARLAHGNVGGIDDVIDTLLDTTAMCGHLLLTFHRFGGLRKVVWPVDMLPSKEAKHVRNWSWYWNRLMKVAVILSVVIFGVTTGLWVVAKMDPTGSFMGVEADVIIGLYGIWFVIVDSVILGFATIGISRSQRYMQLQDGPNHKDEKAVKVEHKVPKPPRGRTYRGILAAMLIATMSTLGGVIFFLLFDGVLGIMISSLTFRLHQSCLLYYIEAIQKWVNGLGESSNADIHV